MSEDAFTRLKPFIRPAAGDRLHLDGGIVSALPSLGAPTTKRFEGLYGSVYNRVVQSAAVRRAVFGAWGSADPLRNLEAFVADAVRGLGGDAGGVVVDLPSGGGTLLPLLEREQFTGTVIAADLADSMLARALRLNASLQPGFETLFLRADVLDLPLRDEVADVVVSINGLHVLADPARFLSEIAHVTRFGGGLWIITPVNGPGVRSRMILKAADALSITPGTPPTRSRLRQLLDRAGFEEERDYGGESIAGFALRRRGS
jgi:SAM-dependent methyltransferase